MLWQISIFGSGGVDPTTLTPDTALTLALKGVSIALAIIGGIVVVYIIVAGLQYIMAGGNSGEQANAKKTITYAIIGLLLVMLSFIIVSQVLRQLSFVGSV